MYTPNYISQLGSELQSWLEKGLVEVEWPDAQFFERQGWVFSLQLLAALFLVILILRNRTRLKESERLRCLAMRPVSAGLFFGFITLAVLYGWVPEVWRLLQLSCLLLFLCPADRVHYQGILEKAIYLCFVNPDCTISAHGCIVPAPLRFSVVHTLNGTDGSYRLCMVGCQDTST